MRKNLNMVKPINVRVGKIVVMVTQFVSVLPIVGMLFHCKSTLSL